jgi:outer membrane protein assembly factor BamE (lipoprotein component of BamABCDE complex)
MKKKMSLMLATCALTLALTACDTIREERGYRLDVEQIAKVESGLTDKDGVLEAMGSPSSVSTFPESGEAWYYIGKKTEYIAFFEKEILEQSVVVIFFDENEVVQEIKNYSKDDIRKIALVDRKTPTGGNKLGFFEQIFGNFGRFNPGAN